MKFKLILYVRNLLDECQFKQQTNYCMYVGCLLIIVKPNMYLKICLSPAALVNAYIPTIHMWLHIFYVFLPLVLFEQ